MNSYKLQKHTYSLVSEQSNNDQRRLNDKLKYHLSLSSSKKLIEIRIRKPRLKFALQTGHKCALGVWTFWTCCVKPVV